VVFAYPLLRWIGVMLPGFGAAGAFARPPAERTALLRRAGIALTLAFVVLRAFDVYGDPRGGSVHPGEPVATAMAFMNTSKYPPSLLFLLMTLGPAAWLTSYEEHWHGWVSDTLTMFGRVPFAFYVAHLYLIHAEPAAGRDPGRASGPAVDVQRLFSEGRIRACRSVGCVAWALVVALLYQFCRWMADVKARRKDWWLSYL